VGVGVELDFAGRVTVPFGGHCAAVVDAGYAPSCLRKSPALSSVVGVAFGETEVLNRDWTSSSGEMSSKGVFSEGSIGAWGILQWFETTVGNGQPGCPDKQKLPIGLWEREKRLERTSVPLQALLPPFGVEWRKAKIVTHLTQRNGLRPGSGVFRFARSVEVVFCRLCGISVWRGPHRAGVLAAVTAAGPARLLERVESLEFWLSLDQVRRSSEVERV
jgi:hypothetical protein